MPVSGLSSDFSLEGSENAELSALVVKNWI